MIGVFDDEIEIQVSVHIPKGKARGARKTRENNLLRGTGLSDLNRDGGGPTAFGGIQREGHVGNVVPIEVGKGATLPVEGNEAGGTVANFVVRKARGREVLGGKRGECAEEQDRGAKERPGNRPGEPDTSMEDRSRHLD